MFDKSGDQNDAHEFLVFLFDKLNTEILKISKIVKLELNLDTVNKEEETEWEEVKKGGKRMKQVNTTNNFQTSIIGNIFQGILKHELEAKGKSLSKCNIEPFFLLSLDYGGTSIESCFKQFFSKRKIETQDGSNLFQKSYIETLPQVLIIHLKAFTYDVELGKIVKILSLINYGPKLKICTDYFSPSKQNLYKNTEYELISGKNIIFYFFSYYS